MNRSQTTNNDFAKIAKAVLKGVIAALIFIAAIVMIAAFIIAKLGAGINYVTYISTTLMGLGSMLGGYVSAKKRSEAGLITGLATGVIVFFIIALISLVVTGGGIGTVFFIRLAICALAAAISGILAVNSSEQQKIV